MKKLGILLLASITALLGTGCSKCETLHSKNLCAETFKNGKLTFEIKTPTTVELINADKDITNVFLSETIDYEGNSYTLTSIRDYAFEDCKSLTSVTIPNSVTSIGTWAFRDCTSLTSITILNSVTSIGYDAFKGTALYNNPANWENGALYIDDCLIKVDKDFAGDFRIKENTRVIAYMAFDGCKSLKSVTIPNSVTSIGDWAFKDCESLSSPIYNIHCFAFMPTSYSGAYTIPNSIKQIAGGAFNGCTSLKSVTIPNSVTSIGEYAFYDCRSLTSVTIPNSVMSIGDWAFCSCSSLTSVTIPNSVTSIGVAAFKGTALYENPANWENGALYIDDCLIKVDKDFAGDFRIKENTQVIATWAFEGCRSLTSVTIPNSVTSIGRNAFWDCRSLTSMVVASGNSTYDSRDNCNAIIETATNTLIAGCQNTTIPNSVTSIGEYAFYRCSSLKFVTIPNSVTSIGEYAFEGCRSLTSVTIPNSVTSIGEKAFYSCSSLKFVTIPDSVTNIGYMAFTWCSSLTSVTIPNSVTSIGRNAFWGCESLTSVTIPNSVTSIGDWAFKWCSSLTSVTIPNSVTSIGEKAFEDCKSLTSVTIPNSVTSIGDGAFAEHTQIIRQ